MTYSAVGLGALARKGQSGLKKSSNIARRAVSRALRAAGINRHRALDLVVIELAGAVRLGSTANSGH
jgi:hypothetical protein